jgi:hypothetical protein
MFNGKVQFIVPADVAVLVPITVGLAKLPVPSLNSIEKIFVVGVFVKLPEMVKVTETDV